MPRERPVFSVSLAMVSLSVGRVVVIVSVVVARARVEFWTSLWSRAGLVLWVNQSCGGGLLQWLGASRLGESLGIPSFSFLLVHRTSSLETACSPHLSQRPLED